DQRADVYALGVILYEMVTGALPYRGNTIYEVAAQALTTPIPPPSQRSAGITPQLEQTMLRALAHDPAERWPTIQRFIIRLSTALPAQTEGSGEMAFTQGSLWRELTTRPLPALPEGAAAWIIADDPTATAPSAAAADQPPQAPDASHTSQTPDTVP